MVIISGMLICGSGMLMMLQDMIEEHKSCKSNAPIHMN